MRKLFTFTLLLIFVFVLFGCQDRKMTDVRVNVVFFTANTGATQVESYLDLEPFTKIEAPEEPTRNGFLFTGWFRDLNRTIPWDFDVDMVEDRSIVLYAGWVPMLFNIIYDVNGGTMPETSYPTTFVPGENKVLPQPRRTGFIFIAWYRYDWEDQTSTKPGDPGLQILPQNVYEDLYLYAHWRAISVVITYRANYPIEGQGPDSPSSRTVAYGDVINFPVLPDTSQYAFIGWNSRRDGLGDWYVNGDIFIRTQRVTLYGIWQPK